MPEQFENGRILDGKNSLQGSDAKEVCLHTKNRSVSCQKRLKMFCFRHFQVFHTRFQNLPAKNVPFSCERKTYPSNFSPFSKCAGIV